MNRTLLTAVALSLAVAASPAEARSGSAAGPGATTLSLALDLDPGPWGGWGVGFRVGLPIAPQGVLHSPKVRDEFQLELGGDYLRYEQNIGYPFYARYSWSGIIAVAGLEWNLWLSPQLALYPKIDLGFSTGWYSGWDPYWDVGYRHRYGGLFAQVAAGVIWRLQALDLRLELGTELVRLGVGFRL